MTNNIQYKKNTYYENYSCGIKIIIKGLLKRY